MNFYNETIFDVLCWCLSARLQYLHCLHWRYWSLALNHRCLSSTNFFSDITPRPAKCWSSIKTCRHSKASRGIVMRSWNNYEANYGNSSGTKRYICTTLKSGTHFTKGSWDHDLNVANIFIALTWKITIKSCHSFAHATTTQLLWHVQNCNMIGLVESKTPLSSYKGSYCSFNNLHQVTCPDIISFSLVLL